MDFVALKDALEQKTGDSWIIGCRLHPNIQKDAALDGVISMTRYPDMQELLGASDCLITDYSSCMFDMAIAGKPCFLYVPDLDEYTSHERGLYFNIMELPFPICCGMDMLEDSVRNFDKSAYQKQINLFLQKTGSYEDGHAAARVAEYIVKAQKYG